MTRYIVLPSHWRLMGTAFVLVSVVAGRCSATPPETAERLSTDDLVRLALKAELRGDNQQRVHLLHQALQQDRNHSAAHWHAGQVRVGRRWMDLDGAAETVAKDGLLKRYREMRADCFERMPAGSVHVSMARWCRQQKLPERERFHWQMVLHQTPDHPEALAALGLVWADGRYWTHDELRQFRDAQRESQQWTARITDLVQRIERNPDSPQAADALDQLRAIDDPTAITGLLDEAARKNARLGCEAVAILGRMPSHWAASALVKLTQSPFEAVRDATREQLRRRPLHQTVPFVLAYLRWPVELEQELAAGPFGLDYHSAITGEGPDAKFVGEVTLCTSFSPLGRVIELGSPTTAVAPARLSSFVLSQPQILQRRQSIAGTYARRAQWDKRTVDRWNRQVEGRNHFVAGLLSDLIGRELPPDPQACFDWWCDYNEVLRGEEKPVYRSDYSSSDVVNEGPIYVISYHSCFPRGTMIWTEEGLRPIEQLQSGDLVLSQNPDTGELAFKSVLQPTVLPPTPVLLIRVSDEHFTVTKGHPFWQSGRGWRMAKFLTPGDLLHGLHGSWPVREVEELSRQEAFNLVVDDFHTYFVGRKALLVHDNSLRRPTTAILPGYHTNTP